LGSKLEYIIIHCWRLQPLFDDWNLWIDCTKCASIDTCVQPRGFGVVVIGLFSIVRRPTLFIMHVMNNVAGKDATVVLIQRWLESIGQSIDQIRAWDPSWNNNSLLETGTSL